MGFFDSPRERKAEELGGQDLASYDDLIKRIMGLKSEYSGINSIGDVENKFGVSTDVSGIFNPQKRNLATDYARDRKAITANSGRSATPEFAGLGAQQNYYGALGNLQSNEAQTKIGREDYIANLLNQILGKKEAFNTGQQSQELGARRDRGAAEQNYLGSLSNSSTFGDILGGLGVGAELLDPISRLVKGDKT